jgi:RNA polymerase sigma-70 factor (ECF subfamily)
VEDARDLTQGFFEHLLENRTLTRADPQQGRFRSFLLGAVKYFLADQRDRRAAIKRGGRIEFLQFDTSMAETRSAAPAQDRSVEAQFDRDWALAVLDRALHRLREEFTLSGRAELYENLKCFLTGEKSTTYAQIAQRLKITEGAAKMTVKRMRERFGAIIRQEISQTVATPEDLQFELRTFIEALA